MDTHSSRKNITVPFDNALVVFFWFDKNIYFDRFVSILYIRLFVKIKNKREKEISLAKHRRCPCSTIYGWYERRNWNIRRLDKIKKHIIDISKILWGLKISKAGVVILSWVDLLYYMLSLLTSGIMNQWPAMKPWLWTNPRSCRRSGRLHGMPSVIYTCQ